MSNFAKTLTGLFLAMILVTCKEKYEPQIEEAKSNYLVVDGMLINGGADDHQAKSYPAS